MQKKWISILPFVIMPAFILPYQILDNLILVDIFGCGCVPGAQTNMLNIAFNANDLRRVVFFALTILMSVWGFRISKRFTKKPSKILYCAAVVIVNAALALWVIQTFMWA